MRHGSAPVIVGLVTLAMGCGVSATEPLSSASGSAAGRPHPVKAELIAEHASVLPGGNTRVGVHFELEEDWHIYAKEPGDAGIPTSIEWSGECTNFSPLGTQWPKPKEFNDPGSIRTFGYDGSVVAYITVTNACQYRVVSWENVVMPVRAKIKWLACREICIPGSADLELALPVTTQPPALSTHAEFFDHAE